MENPTEAKITPPGSMSETFGNQQIAPVDKQGPGILNKVLSIFRQKKTSTPDAPVVTPIVPNPDMVAANDKAWVDKENSFPTAMQMNKLHVANSPGNGKPGATISELSAQLAKEVGAHDVSETPPVAPTAATAESLAAEIGKLAQADAKSEVSTPPSVPPLEKAP